MNKRILITSDSTCDLSPELMQRYHIETIPLHIQLGERSFLDGVEIQPSAIFEIFEKEGILPQTSAVSEHDYTEFFSRFDPDLIDIIHISIGSEFSCCYQNALIAAKEFANVRVIDSCSVSIGTGLLAVLGAELAERGDSIEQIYTYLLDAVPRVEISFVIDTLTFLSKGGRCSSVAALGAGLLHLKPCIEIKNGKMVVGKKYRGKLDQCLVSYVHDRLSTRSDIDNHRIFITHSLEDTSVIHKIQSEIQSYIPFKEIQITKAGCAISSHCGPRTLGIIFMRSV